MLRHLEELDASMKHELRQEQTIRERADQLLYRLLEETCTKVENCLLKRRYWFMGRCLETKVIHSCWAGDSSDDGSCRISRFR